jgi:hypothetical protein
LSADRSPRKTAALNPPHADPPGPVTPSDGDVVRLHLLVAQVAAVPNDMISETEQ